MTDLFHTLNRGVDKRKIFMDNRDYFRFIHNLFEMNDANSVDTASYRFRQSFDIASRKIKRKARKMLVDIHAFCLMPNHYHLLLGSKIENGIPKFMKKLNMAYAKYFNIKHKRTGALFEGRYKSVLIKQESHFTHLPYYIHFNPLDIKFPEWRDRKLKNYKEAIKFLETYRWSSHLDYLGIKNFPSITNRELLLGFFGGQNKYRNHLYSWLKDLTPSTRLTEPSQNIYLE